MLKRNAVHVRPSKWILSIVCIISLIFFACKKKTDPPATPAPTLKGITYPDSTYYGKSILNLPDSTILLDAKQYGFAATLEKDASLSINITDLSSLDTTTGHTPDWGYGNTTGWAVQSWTAQNTQNFIASQTGKIDLQIIFSAWGKSGKCKIDFYENSSSITRTKYLKWQ